MNLSKVDIIAQLRKDIISLQTSPCIIESNAITIDLGIINEAFPNKKFPVGSVHEFIADSAEATAATIGFVSGIIGGLMKNKAAAIWITDTDKNFPPALKNYGIDPDRIIFIRLNKEKEISWVMEEALKCEAIAAVIADIPNLNFTTSRRLQLAVEKSKVTGFVLRQIKKNIAPTACVSRWKIHSLPSDLMNDMPGVGFPRWKVELLKIRNGKPGTWKLEWIGGRFKVVTDTVVAIQEITKKAV